MSDQQQDYKIFLQDATLAAQGLSWHCPQTAGLVPPIHVAATFVRDQHYEKPDHRSYIRDDSVAFEQVEALLCQLEQGSGAAIFPSGMAAIFTTLMQGSGGCVLMQDSVYFGVIELLEELSEKFNIEFDCFAIADLSDLNNKIKKKKNVKIVWIETPSNPLVRVTDIAKTATIAHAHGALLAVDSTLATPVLCKPLTLGADIVCHSATKYLNGHSDILMGATICASQAMDQKIKKMRFLGGFLPGPFECYLLMRGMRTLYLRVERQCKSAMQIAQYLQEHPHIEKVDYPGLHTHCDHEVASQQMQAGFGGMMAIYIKGDGNKAVEFLSKLQLVQRATSLGGVESLIEHRHTVEQGKIGTPENLLRLSVGIESVEDLIADFDQALQAT